jgi:hypothetical protein
MRTRLIPLHYTDRFMLNHIYPHAYHAVPRSIIRGSGRRDAFFGAITRIVRPEAGDVGFSISRTDTCQDSEGVGEENVWHPHGSLEVIAYAALSEPSQIPSYAKVRPMILHVLGRCKHRYTARLQDTPPHIRL